MLESVNVAVALDQDPTPLLIIVEELRSGIYAGRRRAPLAVNDDLIKRVPTRLREDKRYLQVYPFVHPGASPPDSADLVKM